MKSFCIFREVRNLGCLRDGLLSSGFKTVAVVSSAHPSPCVWVHVDDADPDPKDFLSSYADPPSISAKSDKPVGPFGHYEAKADGVDAHVVAVQMKDSVSGQPVAWNGSILVQPLNPIAVNPKTVVVTSGKGSFAVGPTSVPGEYDLWIQIAADKCGYSRYRLHLSFF